MYSFIFFGIYRSLNYTIVSKGKDKQEDRRISATGLISAVIGFHIFTIFGILHHRFGLDIPFLDKPNGKTFTIILGLSLFLYSHLMYTRRLKVLSLKFKPIYDTHKNLDKWIGFCVPILTLILFFVFGTPKNWFIL